MTVRTWLKRLSGEILKWTTVKHGWGSKINGVRVTHHTYENLFGLLDVSNL